MVESKTIYIYYDAGSSLTKVLYRIGNRGKLRFLTMEAESIDLPPSVASILPNDCPTSKISDNAWVRLSSDGDCYLVGRLALDYKVSVSISKLKRESLVPKILAAVGAIVKDEKLPPTLNLELYVLLPFNEYSSRGELESSLKEAIANFWFQNNNYKVNLLKYNCYVEGFGIAGSQILANGIERFQSQRLVYLMFGYRNTSLLFFQNGKLSQTDSCSTKLGFYNFCDFITKKIPGVSREQIQSAIRTRTEGFYNRDTVSRDYRQVTEVVIEDLITTLDSSLVEKERKAIGTAIEFATVQYWSMLRIWLDEALFPLKNLDELVYCGGASEFLSDRLSEYIKSKNKALPLKRTKAIEDSLLIAVELDSYQQKAWQQQNLGVRFADVWGLYQYFSISKRADKRQSSSSKSSASKKTTSKKPLASSAKSTKESS
jgi:hypothetical protein